MLGEKVAQSTFLQVYWAEEQWDETEGRFQVWIFWSLCRVAMNINYLRHVDVTHKRPIISKNFSGWSWRIIRTSWWSFSKWRPEIDSSSSPLSNFESKKRISHFRQLSFAHYSTANQVLVNCFVFYLFVESRSVIKLSSSGSLVRELIIGKKIVEIVPVWNILCCTLFDVLSQHETEFLGPHVN